MTMTQQSGSQCTLVHAWNLVPPAFVISLENLISRSARNYFLSPVDFDIDLTHWYQTLVEKMGSYFYASTSMEVKIGTTCLVGQKIVVDLH